MKLRIISMMMAMVSLTACASCATENDEPVKEEPGNENPEPNPEPSTGGEEKVLVAYFSCTNTTKGVAESVADITGGDLFRIEPTIPYTSADLDYNSDCRANRDQNAPSARPDIKNKVENLTDYEIVFIGYPIWWGEAPRIIITFLESGDFKGKNIIPFCSSHSESGVSREEIFVATKIYPNQYSNPEAAIEECLRNSTSDMWI